MTSHHHIKRRSHVIQYFNIYLPRQNRMQVSIRGFGRYKTIRLNFRSIFSINLVMKQMLITRKSIIIRIFPKNLDEMRKKAQGNQEYVLCVSLLEFILYTNIISTTRFMAVTYSYGVINHLVYEFFFVKKLILL